ncbi:hypothetical protein FDUTEX481_09985 [Tolypothrix sp. PCC 7601]|nr:hypothetical protein FDUTEX481_09985 [Tolypothrix sp. PCC 7601]
MRLSTNLCKQVWFENLSWQISYKLKRNWNFCITRAILPVK